MIYHLQISCVWKPLRASPLGSTEGSQDKDPGAAYVIRLPFPPLFYNHVYLVDHLSEMKAGRQGSPKEFLQALPGSVL